MKVFTWAAWLLVLPMALGLSSAFTEVGVAQGNAQDEASRLAKEFNTALEGKGESDAKAVLNQGSARLLALPGGPTAYAKLAFQLGDSCDASGHTRLAAWAYEIAFHQYDELGIRESAGNALNNAAFAFAELGDFGAAMRLDEQALAYRKGTGNRKYIHMSLTNLAEDATGWRRFDLALGYAERSMALAEIMDQPMLIGNSCTSLGNVLWYLGDFDRAADTHLKALTNYKKTGATAQIASALGNLGATYQALGQLDTARSYYLRAQRLVDKEDLAGRARVLNNLGTLYWRKDEFGKALPLFQESLELRIKGDSPAAQVESYSNLGATYRGLKDLAKATDCYEKGLELAKQLAFFAYEPHLEANIGDVLVAWNSPVAAKPHLDRAMQLLEIFGQPQERAECLRTIADMYKLQGKKDVAITTLEQALALYEDASQHVSQPAELSEFLDVSQRGLYADLAAMLAAEDHPEEALLISDRGRGQGLYRQIGLTQFGLKGTMSRSEAETLAKAGSELSQAEGALQGIFAGSGTIDSPDAIAARDKRDKAAAKLRSYEQALMQKYPAYKRLKGGSSLDSPELAKLLRANPDTLFLEWCSRDKETLLFAASAGGGVRTVRLAVTLKQLKADVTRWREAIARVGELTISPRLDKAAELKQELELEKRLALKLYRSVIEPALAKEGPYRHLGLAPDGPLTRVPFAALRDASGQRLIERYAISSAVSLSSLAWHGTGKTGTGLMAIGYDLPGKKGLPALGSAMGEATAIARRYPNGAALKGSTLTSTQVIRELGRHDIAHFATHAVPSETEGLRSQLIFGSGADGVLQARQVLLAPIRTRLVVMSACSTGIGEQRTGEGQLGLAWAFQAAGCRSTVISQWALNDRAASRMMIDFYSHVRLGTRLDEALQAAARSEMKRSGRDLPFLWANYQLVGSPQPLFPHSP